MKIYMYPCWLSLLLLCVTCSVLLCSHFTEASLHQDDRQDENRYYEKNHRKMTRGVGSAIRGATSSANGDPYDYFDGARRLEGGEEMNGKEKGAKGSAGKGKGGKGNAVCSTSCGGKKGRCAGKGGKGSKGTRILSGKGGKGKGSDKPVKGGNDIVVVNEVSIFLDKNLRASGDNQFSRSNENNALFVRNLISFTNKCPRGKQNLIWIDSRNSRCDIASGCGGSGDQYNDVLLVFEDAGYEYEVVDENEGYPENGIPCEVKVVFILLPKSPLSSQDVVSLQEFAQEGGRIIFFGERGPFYGQSWGESVMNKLFMDLGLSIRADAPANADPGNIVIPSTSIQNEPIMKGVHNLTSSGGGLGVLVESSIGTCDNILFFTVDGTLPVAAVGPIPYAFGVPGTSDLELYETIPAGKVLDCDDNNDDPDCAN
mmetsp:Transcript_20146/g.41073  ORF Transcript_20146/g.41073 Transcript_20146/m.41073 type:complete len:427 (-) Transcript_20146:555-1835(-)|eukprot:CAMPEP_0178644752 /NCGR_PEP_ID=MMETSP0698-20121128/18457_1 /TAXON_ID=265572 /ORGANISM="Extubocellulus spinifer, Strain CCMP396" /LENGTH=426 /DNA_ID=CAMNT_0020285759 /DNA_START=69 /DNA_END=1349 /DNA_ORIENTATION=-